ncbi:MAG: Ig-like domain-containing protein [Longimicrobiales bacterium]
MIRSLLVSRPGTLAVAAALLLLAPAAAEAQLPTATPEQRAAGARVASVDFGTQELVIPRDEAAPLQPRFLDAAGNLVEGVLGVVFAQAGVSPAFAVVTPGMSFTGREPGEGTLVALVAVPEGEGSAFGIDGAQVVGRLSVRVAEWPAASIEVARPEHTAYAGTSLRLGGTVLTDRGTEHPTAAITWRTDDSSVAMVSAGGVFTGLRPGQARVTAATEGNVTETFTVDVVANPVRTLSISPASDRARTGDVVAFDVRPTDADGRVVDDVAVDLSVSGLDGTGGFVFDDGTFVAEEPGAYRVIATVGSVSSAALVEVKEREAPLPVKLQDHGAVAHVATSDLWVFEGTDGRDYAYTGTHSAGGGERMFAWDVTDPTNIVLTDSVVVDARVVNDVKVNAAGTWAIITREGASTRRNGIVVLDLADPAHPTVLAELTDSLTAGIHNVWIDGDVVYAINNGTSAMNIIDMSDPAAPRNVGRWELRPGETDKSLHDVWAEDGYAYLSYWDDGLVILDVGAGTHGGTPTAPEFVSSIAYPEGNTHVAWRDRDYVFVGDEIGTADGMRGFIHVIDISDIDNPVQVAKYDLPEAGAHNVWVEDEVLYIAYYQGGLRIVDVSGTLRGDLYRQGREIGFFRTNAAADQALVPNSPQAWGPQVYKGNVFVSDMHSGLWVIKHARPRPVTF